jgi:triosephosphate isomerase
MICVGETRDEREAGRALDTVSGQLRGSVPDGATAETTVIAYEPVWAIGTGLTPTPADVAEMHARIRSDLASRFGEIEAARIRVLYGGSVKPANARELLSVANVDGALVGGASLVAADFLAIARAYLPN